jgi:modification methylase
MGVSTGGGLKGAGDNSKWSRCALANGYDGHNDAMPLDKYIAWQQEVLLECWRLLSDHGAIFYNHKPRVQAGRLWTPLALNPNLPLRQIVVWKRAGGINFSTSFYLPTYEWIMIFAKPKFRLRDQAASGVKDVWEIPQERGSPHPAPFPVALPRMAIETTTAETVLDPFMGSGSAGVAAIECGRHFVGIEKSPVYFEMARERIQRATDSLLAVMEVDAAASRVSRDSVAVHPPADV